MGGGCGGKGAGGGKGGYGEPWAVRRALLFS